MPLPVRRRMKGKHRERTNAITPPLCQENGVFLSIDRGKEDASGGTARSTQRQRRNGRYGAGMEDPMANETYEKNRLYFVNPAELLPDPEQPRKYLEPVALQEMTESVRQHNVLQPVLSRQDKGGVRYIVAGERRCAAARMAGLTSIPAIFVDGDNYPELSLIENILRVDLTPVEEAEALQRLMTSHAYQQEDLVRIFSKSKANISETLSLTRLPRAVRDECRKDPAIPKRVLIDIARKKQERSMLTAYAKYKAQTSAEKTHRTGGQTTPVRSAVKTMEEAGRKIGEMDLSTLSPQEKETFVTNLGYLKQTVDYTLEKAQPPEPEEEEGAGELA
jgi:ParB family transcriptional regulator, chromosome partitioning protein